MAKETNLTKGISEPAKVDAYMDALHHPMARLMQYLRKVILAVDDSIGEGVYWNAPTFFYTGEMEPFDPREYRRYIVGFNLYRQDELRLVFLHGADASDPAGILKGDYKDGRRIASFKNIDQVNKNEESLKGIVTELLENLKI